MLLSFFILLACYGMLNQVYASWFLFRVAIEGSTEAPNEETTAVPLGKTIKDLEKVKKICQIEAISYQLCYQFLIFVCYEMVIKIYINFLCSWMQPRTKPLPHQVKKQQLFHQVRLQITWRNEGTGLLHSNCVVCVQEFLLTSCMLWNNNQINARSLIGQSAVVYCAGKLMEKSRVF